MGDRAAESPNHVAVNDRDITFRLTSQKKKGGTFPLNISEIYTPLGSSVQYNAGFS